MGGFRATISDQEAVGLVEAGYAAGVRYFDTSPFYGYGRSELRMGAALREKPREDFVLSTKIGRILHAMKPGEQKPADATAKQPVFATLTRWPVTISYFDRSIPQQAGEQTPVYAITFELYENGVSRALMLDYGDFVLSGEMTSIEMKDTKPCK
jgi:aryl-alcohol dehydrogenase-like predicted oxidoreductase